LVDCSGLWETTAVSGGLGGRQRSRGPALFDLSKYVRPPIGTVFMSSRGNEEAENIPRLRIRIVRPRPTSRLNMDRYGVRQAFVPSRCIDHGIIGQGSSVRARAVAVGVMNAHCANRSPRPFLFAPRRAQSPLNQVAVLECRSPGPLPLRSGQNWYYVLGSSLPL